MFNPLLRGRNHAAWPNYHAKSHSSISTKFRITSFRFPRVFRAFHWHGETFDLPPGAVLIARSEGCENQAFQLGQSVIGLQFHLEMTPESVLEIVSHCRAELVPSKYVQSETVITGALPEEYREMNNLMAEVLFFLTNNDG